MNVGSVVHDQVEELRPAPVIRRRAPGMTGSQRASWAEAAPHFPLIACLAAFPQPDGVRDLSSAQVSADFPGGVRTVSETAGF